MDQEEDNKSKTKSMSNLYPSDLEKQYYAYIDFSVDDEPLGFISILLYSDLQPITCTNFISLCKGEPQKPVKSSKSVKYPRLISANPKISYKVNIVHRGIPGFVIHLGDITKNDGRGGKSIYGYKFDDEDLTLEHDSPGLVAMANLGPDTNVSQFYITLGSCSWLDGDYVIFGEILDGMDVVETIGNTYGTQNGLMRAQVKVVDCGYVVGKETYEQWKVLRVGHTLDEIE